MQLFIGTKIIKARPMTRLEYNNYRGWDLPSDEDGSDDGYFVEYLDGGQSNHKDHAGYISWSPEDVFCRAYQPVSGMNFGHAIEMMKQGHRVCRAGWNGKGMWIAITPGSHFPVSMARDGHAAKHRANELMGLDPEASIFLSAHIDMKAADGTMVIGWLASQTDMLANDWMVVD